MSLCCQNFSMSNLLNIMPSWCHSLIKMGQQITISYRNYSGFAIRVLQFEIFSPYCFTRSPSEFTPLFSNKNVS